jgi:hypothetical protein
LSAWLARSLYSWSKPTTRCHRNCPNIFHLDQRSWASSSADRPACTICSISDRQINQCQGYASVVSMHIGTDREVEQRDPGRLPFIRSERSLSELTKNVKPFATLSASNACPNMHLEWAFDGMSRWPPPAARRTLPHFLLFPLLNQKAPVHGSFFETTLKAYETGECRQLWCGFPSSNPLVIYKG